jgi:hypothetical protein
MTLLEAHEAIKLLLGPDAHVHVMASIQQNDAVRFSAYTNVTPNGISAPTPAQLVEAVAASTRAVAEILKEAGI